MLLKVSDLSLQIQSEGHWLDILQSVSLEVPKGGSIALIGNSGSGKSIAVMTILQLLPAYLNYRVSGKVIYSNNNNQTDLLALSGREWTKIRGSKIGVIFQDPNNALNPLQSCGRQILESVRLHRTKDSSASKNIVIKLLQSVGLQESSRFYKAYPHELSGGQLQRVLIAIALAGDPELLIADEPTTNLDAASKNEILLLLESLKKEHGLAMIYITHDLNEAKRMADHCYFIQEGKMVQSDPFKGVIQNKLDKNNRIDNEDWLLKAVNLSKSFQKDLNFLGSRKHRVMVLDQANLTIIRGKTTGLVGASGSGKTTLGRIILNLEKPDRGELFYKDKNLLTLTGKEMRPIRKKLQIVYQNPYNTLNPRMTILSIVREPLIVHNLLASSTERKKRAADLLEKVGIPEEKHGQFLYQLSGGQRQRVAIARALVMIPDFIVLDECISSLDVVTQEKIIELLMELKTEFDLSYLFISHDVKTVKRISDRVYELSDGSLKEMIIK